MADNIIILAKKLSWKFHTVEFQYNQEVIKGVDEGYINQLLSYLIQQKTRDENSAIENFKKLIKLMPNSGFAERQNKKYKAHYTEAKKILFDFKVTDDNKSLLELELGKILPILGWTVKLMKYYV